MSVFTLKTVTSIALLGISGALFAADKVPHVQNGENPIGVSYTLDIVEDLRLGPDQGDNYLWPGLTTNITVDAQGHLFVTNIAESTIMEYDQNGRFVRQMGGKGQGPGEFQQLMTFQILADGRGVALEAVGQMTRNVWFDKDMKFVEHKPVSPQGQIFRSAVYSPDGQRVWALGIKPDMAAKKILYDWMVYQPQSKQVHSLVGYESPFPNPADLSTPDGFAKLMSNEIKPTAQGNLGFVAFSLDGHTYTAVGKKYEITVWDADMHQQFTFGRKYKPIPQTQEDIDAVIEPVIDNFKSAMPAQLQSLFTENTLRKALTMAEFPPTRLPIQGLKVTEDGTVIVIHNVDLRQNFYTGDLFSKEGKFIGTFKHVMHGLTSAQNMVFHNGMMYRVEANDDDETEIVRYHYTISPINKI